jgi:hypothetical protein
MSIPCKGQIWQHESVDGVIRHAEIIEISLAHDRRVLIQFLDNDGQQSVKEGDFVSSAGWCLVPGF